MAKKLVDRNLLINISEQLENIYFKCPDPETRNQILELQLFFDLNVLEKEKEGLNKIKRELYKKMINESDPGLKKKYYDLYQMTKGYSNESIDKGDIIK